VTRTALATLALPFAHAWASHVEARALASGAPLEPCALAVARRVGVVHAHRVRVRVVAELPWPGPLWLRALAIRLRLAPPDIVGVSIGYGIWLRADQAANHALLAHELVHVAQHERLGGLRSFLHAYMVECLTEPGYPAGPLESEALRVAHEVLAADRDRAGACRADAVGVDV